MSHLQIAEVLQTVHKIPSLPMVIMELLASINQEDTDIDALGTKIEQDQALTAKTLRLANSSFYGMAHQITTAHQAISILGFRTIRCLATTAGLIAALPAGANTSFDPMAFWRHGIAAAVCARELAANIDCEAENAYTAALLHDIGRLVLATQFPVHFSAALAYQAEQGCSLIEAESEMLGLDHTAVGHALTRHWNFPSALQDAIALHHTPRLAHEDTLTTVVRAANLLAHGLMDAQEDAHASLAMAALARDIGIESDQWETTRQQITTSFEGVVGVLSL
jgi:putative nucleotidyltransferase with HDIG domain